MVNRAEGGQPPARPVQRTLPVILSRNSNVDQFKGRADFQSAVATFVEQTQCQLNPLPRRPVRNDACFLTVVGAKDMEHLVDLVSLFGESATPK